MRPVVLSRLLCIALASAWAQEIKRPPITGVAHVALFAKDVEASRRFYKDFLGYGEPFDLKNANGSLSLTFIKVNDRQYVEIFPESAPNTDRLNHISIETTDAEAMRKYLASKGVTVPASVPKGRIANSNFNVKDPDGHTVEIVQYEPAGWTVREKGKFMGPQRISTKMIHAGILVGATEAAMRFYRDTLGFVETWRGSRDNTTLSWINLRVPDGTDYVEFMLYSQLPEPTKRGAQHHICLEVPDLDRALSFLMSRREKAGYTQPMEIRTGINRKRQLNLYDPDGTRIELMEPDTVDRVPTPSSKAPPPQVQTGAVRDWQPPAGEVRQKPMVSCTGLRRLTGTAFTVITAVEYAATANAPAFCRVTGQVQPEIRFEVGLPTDWNRRLLMTGNGGYAGDVVDNPERPGGLTALQAGFVSARTNTGHDATREPLGSFAVDSQKLFDYAFRAVHVTAETAKQIAAAYYGRAPERSYFIGCSTGGRQALISAQRFPADFDGILAGAPVLDFTGTITKYASWLQSQGASGFPVSKMKLLSDRIYAQCDAKDGLADGLITDPRQCGFQPARDLPLCAGASAADCFTSAEIKSLESMYGDLHIGGKRVFPGWPVGAEIAGENGQSGWDRWMVSAQGPTIGEAFAETFFRYLAFPKKDPNMKLQQVDLPRDTPALAWIRQVLDATDTDLSAYKARGGKLLMWFGWADPALNPMMGVEYYESVVKKMGPGTRDFFRLFMMPGVFHCAGGVGCDNFPRLDALINWVEQGKTPGRLVASRIEKSTVVRTRPLCPHPEVARYNGQGNKDDEASFTCVAADR